MRKKEKLSQKEKKLHTPSHNREKEMRRNGYAEILEAFQEQPLYPRNLETHLQLIQKKIHSIEV